MSRNMYKQSSQGFVVDLPIDFITWYCTDKNDVLTQEIFNPEV